VVAREPGGSGARERGDRRDRHREHRDVLHAEQGEPADQGEGAGNPAPIAGLAAGDPVRADYLTQERPRGEGFWTGT